ncbi:hypothetical protein JCM8547_004217 [Rhodosporidiobolus lusitaniae]
MFRPPPPAAFRPRPLTGEALEDAWDTCEDRWEAKMEQLVQRRRRELLTRPESFAPTPHGTIAQPAQDRLDLLDATGKELGRLEFEREVGRIQPIDRLTGELIAYEKSLQWQTECMSRQAGLNHEWGTRTTHADVAPSSASSDPALFRLDIASDVGEKLGQLRFEEEVGRILKPLQRAPIDQLLEVLIKYEQGAQDTKQRAEKTCGNEASRVGEGSYRYASLKLNLAEDVAALGWV